MLFWVLAAVVLFFVALMVYWTARFCYRMVFFNQNDKEDDAYAIPSGDQYAQVGDTMRGLIRELDTVPYEQIFITSRDGLRLAARYYHFFDGGPVQIQFHGYRGNSIREYSAGRKMAMDLGYNSIVVDERAHGKSEGHTITFGIKERFDCLDWVNYACERFGDETPIILSGVSMGAATVLMASELDLPKNVVGISADCPYSSPGAIIRKVCEDMKVPGWAVYPFVAFSALMFGHFRLWQSSPIKAVKHTKIPIQLIHGEDDRFVPCDMSRAIYKACAGPKRLVTFPGAGHGLSYLVDSPKYEAACKDFLRSCGIGA